MGLRDRLTGLAVHAHLPRRTIRLRLTALYGALFLASGAGLLGITYVLVSHASSGCYTYRAPSGVTVGLCGSPSGAPGRPPTGEHTQLI